MTGAQLLALAERVEAATRPDREMDAEIAFATGWRKRNGEEWRPPGGEWGLVLPPFTENVGAALMTKREDCSWGAGDLDEDGNPWACLTPHVEPSEDFSGKAVNVPMSVVAASLRALAARSSKGTA